MPGKAVAATFLTFYYMFTHGSLRRGDVIDVIFDTEGAHESLRRGNVNDVIYET